MSKKNLAIFASGQGTNADNIIKQFADTDINTKVIVTNNPNAGVRDVSAKYDIPFLVVGKNDFYDKDDFLNKLELYRIDLIVLAGFLWLIPPFLIKKYQNRIINIHPALLPRYGGKGMYGMKVHEAVKKSGDKKSGITIHYVNENYDEGNIIFQAEVYISNEDTPRDIANKIHELEYKYFPEVIKKILS